MGVSVFPHPAKVKAPAANKATIQKFLIFMIQNIYKIKTLTNYYIDKQTYFSSK